MTERAVQEILERVARGRLAVGGAMRRLRRLPFEDLGFAKLDHHRRLRRGLPEVVLGEYKSADQIVAIGRRVTAAGYNLIVTRLAVEKSRAIKRRLRKFNYRLQGELGFIVNEPTRSSGHGTVMVISAGTSDLRVAEEAALCSELFGNRVERLYDVGVAGLHRLTASVDALKSAAVLIVVAGMEGALPSVVAGLLDKPVIAVPTSAGYGAALGGLTALFGMLNSCAGGVTVVNIDNGFGAAFAATLINRTGLGRPDER
jgi:NCAIR mutase (PurE)-related protein